MAEDVDKHMNDARAALAAGEAQKAFQTLRWLLHHPSPIAIDTNLWRDAVTLFAEVCAGVGATKLADCARTVIETPTAKALYSFGYELIEEKLDLIAATFLARAVVLAPNDEGVLNELVSALEGAGLHGEARRRLEQAPRELVEKSFMCSYLLAFNTLMTADVQRARERQLALKPQDDTQRFMQNAIHLMLLRAEALLAKGSADTLSERDLRGWHFVINSTVLLHRSPYGMDEGMLGRFAFIQDTYARCHDGLKRLKGVCDQLGYAPKVILELQDRHSMILAKAASAIFDVPIVQHAADPTRAGLIVGYDLQHTPFAEASMRALLDHAPGQAFYEHAACWTAPFPIASDVANYLHQFNTAPWDERTAVSADGKPKKEPADARSPDLLAKDVLAANEKDDDALPNEHEEVAALAAAILTLPDDAKPALLRQSGRRSRNRTDSPVKSSRFA